MHEYEYDIEREEILAATLLIPFLARQQGISSDQAHMGSFAAFSILSYIFYTYPRRFPHLTVAYLSPFSLRSWLV